MREKRFKPIVLLVLIIVAISGYFGYRSFYPKLESLKPLTDQVKNWNTYISDKYGFSFKYPYSWKVIQDKDMHGRVLPTFHLVTTVTNKDYYALNILISDETQLEVSDYFQEILASKEIIFDSQSVKSNFLVDSQPSVMLTDAFLSGYGQHHNAIYTIYHNKSFSFINPTNNLYKETVEQIISTFKFQNTPMEPLYEKCDVNKQYYNTLDNPVECRCPKDYVITGIDGSSSMVQCKKWR